MPANLRGDAKYAFGSSEQVIMNDASMRVSSPQRMQSSIHRVGSHNMLALGGQQSASGHKRQIMLPGATKDSMEGDEERKGPVSVDLVGQNGRRRAWSPMLHRIVGLDTSWQSRFQPDHHQLNSHFFIVI